MNIIKDANMSHISNWTQTTEYLNSKIPLFKKLIFRLPIFCLQKPQSQGSLDLPYGQATIAPCANTTVMDEIFIIKEDGHVSV